MISMEKIFVFLVLCFLSVVTTLMTLIKSIIAGRCDMVSATGKIKSASPYRSRMIVKYEYEVEGNTYKGSYVVPADSYDSSADEISIEYRSDKPSVSVVPGLSSVKQEARSFARCAVGFAVVLLFMFTCSPWKFLFPIMKNIDRSVTVHLSDGIKGRHEIMFDIEEVKQNSLNDNLCFTYSIPLRTLFSQDFDKTKLFVIDEKKGKSYMFNPMPVRLLCGIMKTDKSSNHLFPRRICNSDEKKKFSEMVMDDENLWFVSLPMYQDGHIQLWCNESIGEMYDDLYGDSGCDMDEFVKMVMQSDDEMNGFVYSLRGFLEKEFGETKSSRTGIILNRGTDDAVYFPGYEVMAIVRELGSMEGKKSEKNEEAENVNGSAGWWN